MIPALDPATVGFSTTLEDLVGAAASAGFRAVEFPIWAAEKIYREGRLPAVLRGAAALGVRVSQFTCGTGTPANIAVSTEAFELSLEAWARNCRFAMAQGFTHASVLVNGSIGGACPEAGVALGPVELVGRLRRVGDIAAANRVCVAVEISDAGLWQQASEIIVACKRDNVRLLVDTFHLHRAGSIEELLRGLPPGSVGWVQLADAAEGSTGPPRRVLPGDGGLPLDDLLEAVGTLGYEGEVSIEVQGEVLYASDTPAERARQAAATLRRAPLCRHFQLG